MIMLDTDVLIDLLRKYPPALEWINSIEEDDIAISGFVAVELLSGSRNKKEKGNIEKLISQLSIFWPSEKICKDAYLLFSENYLRIGINISDCIIGYTALYNNVPIHTFNKKHYEVVSGLKIIEPYKK